MKVRCKTINVSEVSKGDELLQAHIADTLHLDEIDLQVGVEYTVYGLVFWNGHVRYYLCGDADDDYPTPYLAAFFDLVDASVPEGWSLSLEGSTELVPKEWANRSNFYERLIEGHAEEVEIFSSLKYLYA
jgi:hypothetical protein